MRNQNPKRLKKLYIYLLLLTVSFQVFSQDVDLSNIKEAKLIKLSGGLSFNSLYNSYVPVNSPNLSYFVNGSLNVNILDAITVPITLSYSNRNFNFAQPFSFNQLALTPRYKWAMAHIGTSAMTFSPYTLNGHQFTGFGFELTPNKWQISAMYGRLIRAFEGNENAPASYRRRGVALKTMYNPGTYRVGFTVFHAADDPNSVDIENPLLSISPQENLVLGLQFGVTLPLGVEFDVDYTNSIIEENSLFEGNEKISSLAGIFFRGNSSAKSYNAFKAGLTSQIRTTGTTVGLNFERVDPFYRTFGGYFFTNDFQNITINANQGLFESKLNLATNVGFQRDLLTTKTNGQTRFVGSLNATYTPNQKLNFAVGLSNFRGFTFIRDIVKENSRESALVPIDTLNFTQINRNLNANIGYNYLQNESRTQSLSLSGSIMDAANKQGEIIRVGQASQVYNFQLSHALNFTKTNLSAVVGLNFNKNTIGRNDATAFGPTANIRKSFLKNTLSTGLSYNYLVSSNTSTEGTTSGSVSNLSFNSSYTLKERHALNLTYLLLSRNIGNVEGLGNVPNTISTLNFGYNLRF